MISLLITDGESRATEVFRTIPLLVVDGKIGNFPSRDFLIRQKRIYNFLCPMLVLYLLCFALYIL